MVKLWDSSYSTCPRKARFALHEKGVPYESVEVDFFSEERRDRDGWFRRENPTGVLPLLEHEGKYVRESTVICEYIDETFDGPPLLPADTHARAQARLWMKRLEVEIHFPHHLALNYALAFTPQLDTEEIDKEEYLAIEFSKRRAVVAEVWDMGLGAPSVRAGIAAYENLIADLEVALSDSDWLAGDSFSLAEVGVAPWVFRICKEFGYGDLFFDERPNVAEWTDRVTSRPAFREAIERPEAAEWLAAYGKYGDQGRAEIERLLAEVRATPPVIG